MTDLQNLEQMPLEVLALSALSYNALRRRGIETIQDLAQLSDEEILQFRGVGAKILAEIRAKLEAFVPTIPRPAPIAPEHENASSSAKHSNTPTTDLGRSDSESEQIPLEVLGLSIRPHKALERRGIGTVERLAAMSDEEILAVRNVGARSLAEIRKKLASFHADTWAAPELVIPKPQATYRSLPKPLLGESFMQIFAKQGVSLDTISIERLALPESLEILLKHQGIQTLGNLARQPQSLPPEEAKILPQLRLYLNWLLKQDQDRRRAEIANQGISPMHLLMLKETSLAALIAKWLSVLPNRHQQVIRWRYALDGDEGWTLEQIGQHFDLTRERVRQIENKTLRLLRKPQSRDVIQSLRVLLVHWLEQAGGLIGETPLADLLIAEMSIEGLNPEGVICLVLRFDDRVRRLGSIKAWGLTSLPLDKVAGVQKRLIKLLSEERAPLTVDELLARFRCTLFYQRSQNALNDHFVTLCLTTCPDVVVGEDRQCRLTGWEGRRTDKIVLALREIGEPAHYAEIAEVVNRMLPADMQTDPHNIHAQMQRLSDIFVWVARGTYGLAEWGLERPEFYVDIIERVLRTSGHPLIRQEILTRVCQVRDCKESTVTMLLGLNPRFCAFIGDLYGLAEWERARATEIEPVLPVCPTPLPDPPDQPSAFLESVMVTYHALQPSCDITALLHALIEWAGLPWPQPRWVCQGALSAYYLIGVMPYVFYVEGEEQSLSLTLPVADLAILRTYCLDTLSSRLQAMPEFWWLLRRHQPVHATALAQLFVAVHPLGLDDVANRLTLLISMGAVQKSSVGDRYQLTHLGETLAGRWARQPENTSTATNEPVTEEEWDFAELSFE